MSRFIIKRLLIIIPTLLAIIFIVFGIMSFTPGNPARSILGQRASQEKVDELNEQLGFNKPFPERYWNYVRGLAGGSMGVSYSSGREVGSEVFSRFPTTARLASVSIILAVIIGLPLGILAAVKQYSVFDIIGTAVAMLMASMPGFWFGLMAILLFSLKLGLLPPMGSETWKHFILPAFTLAIPVSASLLRLTRTTMLETIRQDYIRTSRAKGQVERKVIVKHALKNALLPVITVAGMEFGYMLGGAVVVEQVFSINGIGKFVIDSIRMKDVPAVTGCALLLAFFFMLVMLVIDILYAFIDPRVRAMYARK